jgi:hypothetical protein
MGFSDTFDFDEAAYVRKLKSRSVTLQDLRSREVRALRQHVSSGFSVGSGVGLAFFTAGLSLFGSAYGGRRLYLATKKLELIREELDRRGEKHYEPTKRDVLIPLGVSMATLGVGVGIDSIATQATSHLAAQSVAHHGSSAIHDVVCQPHSFVQGLEEGISAQVHEVANVVTTGMQHANAVAGTDSYFLIAGSSLLPASELVGFAAGQSIALVAEQKVACFVSEKIAYRLINASSGTNSQAITYFKPPDDCRRVIWQASGGYIWCEHCELEIPTDKETYYRKILYSNSQFFDN